MDNHIWIWYNNNNPTIIHKYIIHKKQSSCYIIIHTYGTYGYYITIISQKKQHPKKRPGLCATDLARYVVSGKDEPLEVTKRDTSEILHGKKKGAGDHFDELIGDFTIFYRPFDQVYNPALLHNSHGDSRSKLGDLTIKKGDFMVFHLMGRFDGTPKTSSNHWDIAWKI